jgi:putative transposase
MHLVDAPQQGARRTGNLHIGRVSLPGARYFVTLVTAQRKRWLASQERHSMMLDTLALWHSRKKGRVLAATVMPDHVHVLFELGDALTLGQSVALWKADVRRKIAYEEVFQRDFWEHRLRADEEAETYALYVFLNPFRDGLIRRDETWTGWWAPEPDLFRFSGLLENGMPPREWINWPKERFGALKVGE